jgi:hypothetical protein
MFTYRPRDLSAVQTSVSRVETPKIDEQTVSSETIEQPESEGVTEVIQPALNDKNTASESSGGKKRRRRHR